jgi:hypothetical protein
MQRGNLNHEEQIPHVKHSKVTAQLILAGLGGALILWLGIWLNNQYWEGETSPAPALAEEGIAVHQPVDFANPLTILARDWMKLEPWSGRSINFHAGVQSPNRLLSPVLLVALWVALAGLLFALSSRRIAARQITGGMAILFLTGWLVLDMRWQWQLATRLVQTYERYGHLPITEREQAMPDARIALAVDRMRQALPEQPLRLIILSNDPSDYVTHRVRYHFLPNRVYATDRLPAPRHLHEGDSILVLTRTEAVHYDQRQGLLMGNQASIPVEYLGRVPGFGALYRVTGGN